MSFFCVFGELGPWQEGAYYSVFQRYSLDFGACLNHNCEYLEAVNKRSEGLELHWGAA